MKTISRIAYSNDKKNRTRSILIMMAICLTTMLLVIISTVGNGLVRLQKSQAADSYGSNYGLFVSADGSQVKEVNRRAEIDATIKAHSSLHFWFGCFNVINMFLVPLF